MSGDDGLTRQQVHVLLHDLDAMYDQIMEQAETANEGGGWQVAHGRAMKAHGVLKAFREVQRHAGIEPVIWEAVHRRTPPVGEEARDA